ncbi:MAG TPA: hypothetical protein VFY79_09160 [Dehalococcoidia bacterium]|nr:hypothetical protein [Dehalococcoidia bacterium]
MTSRTHQRELAERTNAEHHAISGCLAGLEASLAAPGTPAWRRRIEGELAPLIACLAGHAESAESSTGLLVEIEITLGRSHEVTTARRLHASASRQASELSDILANADSGVADTDVVMHGRRLASAIQRHHELEADLILMAFDQDIGTVD